MKGVLVMFNKSGRVFKAAILIAVFCASVAMTARAQGVVLETLNVPSEITMYSTMSVSGTYRNTGTSVYFGPVGIDVEIKDNVNSSESHFEPLFLTTATIPPGGTYNFSGSISVTPDKFSANGYDIVIIYPLVVNINPSTTAPQTFNVFVRSATALPGTTVNAKAKGGGN